ncbi:MAG: hypothetical protein DHS20C17_09150 [Cyclobacteriaceae bacterium]|nr:MAG: hypothetical protein DHS20C17_09150 [Cyclobacteriaceae bacterium]
MSNISKKFMKTGTLVICIIQLVFWSAFPLSGQSSQPFESKILEKQGDLSAQMVDGISTFLDRKTQQNALARDALWNRNFSTPELFDESVKSLREHLALRCGVTDVRVTPEIQVFTNSLLEPLLIETTKISIHAVKWAVLEGLWAEGLLVKPKGPVKARVVLLPDADVIPEVLAGMTQPASLGFGAAQTLAAQGCEVLIPTLVNRQDTYSGNPSINRFTNQPHREWIYRQAYEVGRHIIGYELQKIFAAVDWMNTRDQSGGNIPIGVAGHGEGGLLALYASAIDTRIASTLVSGYFNTREHLWEEPIYRNVFGLLQYFGDAELAVMSWPRTLVIEQSQSIEVSGPPGATENRRGAAPGRIITPNTAEVEVEIAKVRQMLPEDQSHLHWVHQQNGEPQMPFSQASMALFAKGLKLNSSNQSTSISEIQTPDFWVDAKSRQQRTVKDIEHHVQQVLHDCEQTRNQQFWDPLKVETSSHQQLKSNFRQQFGNQIGMLPAPSVPFNPRSRILQETERWTRYEIMLDVWPDVYAWGILVVPKNLKQGEKRPVVVCQHGLEGLPIDMVSNDPEFKKYPIYQGLATKLAERGYVTFAPHNPYRGEDKFRVLQRKANPLGLSLFSIIVGQHQRIVDWLGSLSFVNPDKIGFYGLSYGGKTAMRVPALVEGYSLSICSADFNEWVKKNAATDFRASYMFTGEYEMPEWDLGHTFNYAEMAGLIAPRPFMVERGHHDGVGIDEWVAYEFAKVRRHYNLIGLPDNCRIEYFNGVHRINGVGTVDFLDQHLWKTVGASED